MKHSCGALLYSKNNKGEIGIILGRENDDVDEIWFNFKGCTELNETFEQAAIREIREETKDLINIKNINLFHNFNTKHKYYHIGLLEVPINFIDKFNKIDKICEKKEVKFFLLKDILSDISIHNTTKASILYYWNDLNYKDIHNKTTNKENCLAISMIHAINLFMLYT